MRRGVMRRLSALLLLLACLPGTFLRDPPIVADDAAPVIRTALAIPAATTIGPFRLTEAWLLTSRHRRFGGYSGLVAQPDGSLLALGDGADWLRIGPGNALTIGILPHKSLPPDYGRDSEGLTRDPATGKLWIAWEKVNAISRHGFLMKEEVLVRPAAMRGWPENTGPESLLQLADGRFVVLSESRLDGSGRHAGVLFPGDPTAGAEGKPFVFEGIEDYRPTDMAQLPDGRVLVLLRRVVWPLPLRFSIRIALADPAELAPGKPWRAQEIAAIDPPLPTDNYEGMAITPSGPGKAPDKADVWLISDENASQFQRVLLLRLELDLADLPRPSKTARRDGPSAPF